MNNRQERTGGHKNLKMTDGRLRLCSTNLRQEILNQPQWYAMYMSRQIAKGFHVALHNLPVRCHSKSQMYCILLWEDFLSEDALGELENKI